MRKTKTVLERFEKYIFYSPDGCWYWTGCLNIGGYGVLNVSGKMIVAHRVSYQLFHGDLVDDLCICHKCDNRLCVNPDHLFMGTLQDNNLDMFKKGRQYTKIKSDVALKIRHSAKMYVDISKEFGVAISTVFLIKKNITWKHI